MTDQELITETLVTDAGCPLYCPFGLYLTEIIQKSEQNTWQKIDEEVSWWASFTH
jgi:hypothetical protein